MKNCKGFTTWELLVVLFWLIACFGWVANIIKLVDMSFDPITIELVLRLVGVIAAPLGVIMGYL